MTDATETPTERFLVTMRSAFLLADGQVSVHEATDHVGADILDAYVEDAKTRWQFVGVADEPDPTVAPDADYVVPEALVAEPETSTTDAPQEG